MVATLVAVAASNGLHGCLSFLRLVVTMAILEGGMGAVAPMVATDYVVYFAPSRVGLQRAIDAASRPDKHVLQFGSLMQNLH
jgi:hypothetical protein